MLAKPYMASGCILSQIWKKITLISRDFHCGLLNSVIPYQNILFLFIFHLIPLDREVIEYSLTKLLERLQINHQEVSFWKSNWLKITFFIYRKNHIYLPSFFFLPVCGPVYSAGLRLLRKNMWVGSKEGSETDPEASHYWERAFTHQQEGTPGFVFVCFCFFFQKPV